MVQVNIDTPRKNNSKCEKLLGIKIDCQLNFDDHIGYIFKKADTKLNTLTRVAQSMNKEKKALNYECFFFSSQFNYCPFTWKLHNIHLVMNY